MVVLPDPCCAGLKGQCVCLAQCQAWAQRCLDYSDPSFCLAAYGSAKPNGISSELGNEGQESRREPSTGPLPGQCRWPCFISKVVSWGGTWWWSQPKPGCCCALGSFPQECRVTGLFHLPCPCLPSVPPSGLF